MLHLSSFLTILGASNRVWEDIEYGVLLVSLLLSLSAIAYYCYAIYAATQFFSCPPINDYDFHPPVSILKPICGSDSKTYDNLASFCRQDYPKYQIIFGIQDCQDSSVEVVKQIIQDFPDVDVQFVISDRIIGTNRKVSNLAQALVEAKYETLLLADSDVCVKPNYLQPAILIMKHMYQNRDF